ncbi:uncharacterized protein [Leptinotarsa decemlineata]|uniref:uncharacterized protein n=1 Tax=Leptinotarsa decemlineata TaxID=7539 RepID=UPI003D30C278
MNITTVSDSCFEENNSEDVSETEFVSDDDFEEHSKELHPPNLTSYLKSLDISCPSSSRNLDFDQEDEHFLTNCTQRSKYSMITEDQTSDNFMKQFDGFYKEMIGKVRSLRNTPALCNQSFDKTSNVGEENLFKNLKDTPEVAKKMNAIKKLDDEIKNIVSLYKVQKSERLQTQLEMCNEIYNNDTLPERDSHMFLELCNFEFSEDGVDDEQDNDKPRNSKTQPVGTFIKRNIELAKEGFLANYSLTDEEKIKLENILSTQDDDNEEENINEIHEYISGDEESLTNAYLFTNESESRINDIDTELEKFSSDERANEKNNINENIARLNDCMLKLSLDKIDSQLNELRVQEEKEKNVTGSVTVEINEDCSSSEDA